MELFPVKKSIFITLIIILCFLISFSTSCLAKKIIDKPSVVIGNQIVSLEIADTAAKRQRGLMERKSLPDNHGMLFIFDEPTKPVFWMKDCFISLDIIFIKDSKIVNMYQSVPPCQQFPCEQYPSVEFVDRVLEVSAGFTKKHNVKINDKVEFVGFRLK